MNTIPASVTAFLRFTSIGRYEMYAWYELKESLLLLSPPHPQVCLLL